MIVRILRILEVTIQLNLLSYHFFYDCLSSNFRSSSLSLSRRQLFPSNNEEEEQENSKERDVSTAVITDDEQGTNERSSKPGDGNKVDINTLLQNLNKKQKRTLSREYERQGNEDC